MKLVILIALIALAVSAPADKKPAEKTENNKESAAANDEKKPVEKPDEKKDEERKGLQWPLPDPSDEGDLMLHGSHLFDRVEELHKGKVDKDEDKMVLSVGREYLRRVHKFIEKTTDFKVLNVLCRDSERMSNISDRWEIRILPGKQTRFNPWGFATDGQTQKQQQTEQIQSTKQNDAPPSKETKQNDPSVVPSNATHELNTTENLSSNATNVDDHSQFETIRKEYYKRMGDNFGRLLMKRYRKEKLEKEETEWLARWVSDESIHYGMMSIFCHEGENVKDITKRIATLINEKP